MTTMKLPDVLPSIGLIEIILKAGGHAEREQAVCAMERERRADGTFRPEPVSSRFWRFVRKGDGCWEWLGAKSDGYGTIHHAGRQRKAHRIAYELKYGVVPDGASVLHRCDNPSCVNTDHLFLGTIAENNADRARKGRSADVRGANSPRAKLTTNQAAEVKRRRLAGETITALAREFGIHHSAVSRIAKGQTWTAL